MSKRFLTVATETLRLRVPFHISGYTFHEAPVVVVTIWEDGVSGRGEASGVYYRDDDAGRDARGHRACPCGHREAASRARNCGKYCQPCGARNALDCALWELQANQERRPVWQIANLPRPKSLLTTVTLSAEAPEVMANAARELTAFRAIKLKLTGDASLDAKRVEAVRAARPDAWLSVDANQGYSIEMLRKHSAWCSRASRSALLEQPLQRGREADLDGLHSPIPIAADEHAGAG